MENWMMDHFGGIIAVMIALILALCVILVAETARTKAAFYTKMTGQPMTTWEAVFIDPQFSDNQVKVRQ